MNALTSEKKPSLKAKFNPKVLVLALVLGLPLGWVVYTVVKLTVGGGIEQVGDYKEVNLKSMGNFSFDETSADPKQIPDIYRALDGQKVLLVGEMYSDLSSAYTDNFQLVYSIAKCCFGGPPKVQERVYARIPAGKKVPIVSGLVKCYGILHAKPEAENGKVRAVYTMDVQKMEPYE